MKKRTKAYRPKPIKPLAAFKLFAVKHIQEEDKQPLNDDQVTDLAIAYRLALADMLGGRASEDKWSVVVCSLNIGMILCERGIGREFESKFIEALDGAFRAKVRADISKHWGFDGPAIQAIRMAFEVHDVQIEHATKEEMRAALIEVRRRIDEGVVYEVEPA